MQILKTVQKRFRLSGILATCPSAGPDARQEKLAYPQFLEPVLRRRRKAFVGPGNFAIQD